MGRFEHGGKEERRGFLFWRRRKEPSSDVSPNVESTPLRAPASISSGTAAEPLSSEFLDELSGSERVEVVKALTQYEVELAKIRQLDRQDDLQLEQAKLSHRLELIKVPTQPVIAVGFVMAGVTLALSGNIEVGLALIGAAAVALGGKARGSPKGDGDDG